MSAASVASYVWGQCTYYVAKSLDWIPGGLGNADEWLTNAKRKGLQTTNIPTTGSVVVYGAGNGYDPQFGHVAKVEKVNSNGTFVVSEMNFKGENIVDTRTSTMQDVEGFILAPGMSPGQGGSDGGSGAGIPIIGDAIAAAITNFQTGVQNLVLTSTFAILGIALVIVGLIMIARPVIPNPTRQVATGGINGTKTQESV